MFSSPGNIALSLGSLDIRWYGIIVASSILAALWYAVFELKRQGKSPEPLYDMGFWIILGGILGARLYYVIFQWDSFAGDPLKALMIWNGGLAIHGGLLGGFLAFLFFAVKKKLVVLHYLDVLIPGVVLAQAIGRWGNFFNNEAFGRPTDLPWKLFIPMEHRPDGFKAFEFYHPTFLYESLWNLFVFVVLLLFTRHVYKGHTPAKNHGTIFFAYLISYSVGRFFIEGLRMDSLYVGGLRTAQITSLVLVLVGIAGLFFLRKSKSPSA